MNIPTQARTMVRRWSRTIRSLAVALTVAPMLVLALGIGSAAAARGDDVDRAAVAKARNGLEGRSTGVGILRFVHAMAEYRDHALIDGDALDDGAFRLTYRYTWSSGFDGSRGTTDMTFYCNGNGQVVGLRMGRDASVVPPFVGADLMVAVIGQTLLESDSLNREQKRDVRRLLEAADARKFLVWVLGLSTI